MSVEKTVFFSTKVVLPEGVKPAAILVEDGVIAEISPNLPLLTKAHPTAQVHNFGKLLLYPGLVDSHAHINSPTSEWESWSCATRAAVKGGVTTVVDMPLNSLPVTTSMDALTAKQESMKGQIHCDVALLGGVVPANATDASTLSAMVTEGGVVGFKCFTCHSGLDDFPNVSQTDISAAIRSLSDTHTQGFDPVLMFHAEHPEALAEAPQPADDAAAKHHDCYAASRPPACETRAIAEIVIPAMDPALPLRCHIVHLSAAEAMPTVLEAQSRGYRLTVETTFNYLYHLSENVHAGGTAWKCAPPIRDLQNHRQLWEALTSGHIAAVVSDHSPCPPAMKDPAGSLSFMAAWGGIASLGMGIYAMATAGHPHAVTPLQLAQWLAEGPAGVVGLRPAKGTIAVGQHADFAVVDPEASHRIDRHGLQFLHKVSPYMGHHVRGRVMHTFVHGTRVYHYDVAKDCDVFDCESEPVGCLLRAAPNHTVVRDPLTQ